MFYAPAFRRHGADNEQSHERCAGIDIGKRFLLCCALTGAAAEEPQSETLRFEVTVAALQRLRE
jgi:hypothetical protein